VHDELTLLALESLTSQELESYIVAYLILNLLSSCFSPNDSTTLFLQEAEFAFWQMVQRIP